MPAAVRLHIYDVSRDEFVAKVNKYLHPLGTGAFHGGVEVYGTEWSYGFAESGSGVFPCPPTRCTAHHYRETIEMGYTAKTSAQVHEIVNELKRDWQGKDYDLLRRNCCVFSDDFCERLGVGHVPAWVTNLAAAGATLQEGVVGAVTTGQLAAILAAAKAGEFDSRYNIRGNAHAKAQDVMAAARDLDGKFQIKETAIGVVDQALLGAQRAMNEVAAGAESQGGLTPTPRNLDEDPFLQGAGFQRRPVAARGGAAGGASQINHAIGQIIGVCIGRGRACV